MLWEMIHKKGEKKSVKSDIIMNVMKFPLIKAYCLRKSIHTHNDHLLVGDIIETEGGKIPSGGQRFFF